MEKRIILHSVDGDRSCSLPAGEWERLIGLARERGWSPEGTQLDYRFECFMKIDDDDEPDDAFFEAICIQQYCLGWDGNYLDPMNQVVSADDVYDLLPALMDAGAPPDLLCVLRDGAFRICA